MTISKTKFMDVVHKDLDLTLAEMHLPAVAYERVLKVSFAAADQRTAELAAALGGSDWLTAQRIAHELKGVFGNLRIEPLFQLAKDMECALKEVDGVADKARKIYEDFAEKLKALKDVFENEGG